MLDSTAHLSLQLPPYTIFFVGLDNEMVIIQILNYEALLFVHHNKYLFDSCVATFFDQVTTNTLGGQ
jgi:hypothetical protein